MAIIVVRDAPVRRCSSKGTTGKLASKVARVAAKAACREAVAAVAEDPLVVSSVAISAEEEAADLRVVLAARTAK